MPSDLHPERLTACFRTIVAGGFLEGLMGEARFAGRLADVVSRHYGLTRISADGAAAEDLVLADLGLNELRALALRAGVILHSKAFLQEIRGPVVAALIERFGSGALDDARRHFDLIAERPKAADLDELQRLIQLDGEACLAAWIASLPPALSARVRLKWPDDHALPKTDDVEIIARGPTIMRRLVKVADTNP
ncbi:hypothetical protein ELG83_24310 (plasmid) [Rhizobium leguminosarum]|uniref:hypothetical protein n=1 Tax=Rhizobium TaxID=379 RepID=UPI001030FF29|nr:MULTISPECIES: hypothetical protein [Rhizobium]MBY5378374.1 hypothetical protein [Rhizobium leguminosarum]TBF35123.1 hypothetical protein ELG88_07780 [Rhizobium leguminosarum]TBF87977.1 hypothetical protein ELG83_24310 [Rhizobium leguminosarum]WSH48664.1 hypothetical protein U8P77_35740 [Rhizobium johnstonii]